MDLKRVAAVLKVIFFAVRPVGQFSFLPDQDQSSAEHIGECSREKKPSRVDSHHLIDLHSVISGCHEIDHFLEELLVLQEGRDVLEGDPLLRPILYHPHLRQYPIEHCRYRLRYKAASTGESAFPVAIFVHCKQFFLKFKIFQEEGENRGPKTRSSISRGRIRHSRKPSLCAQARVLELQPFKRMLVDADRKRLFLDMVEDQHLDDHIHDLLDDIVEHEKEQS